MNEFPFFINSSSSRCHQWNKERKPQLKCDLKNKIKLMDGKFFFNEIAISNWTLKHSKQSKWEEGKEEE